MREFIRLQFKLKWGLNRNNNKASAIMTAVAAAIAVIIALALVYVLAYVLKANLSVAARKLSTLFLTIIVVAMTVAATSMQVKRLYRPADLMIAARFPISPFKLFVSYIILNYIDLFIYSTIVSLPVLIAYGIAVKCISFVYVLGVILTAVLMPLIPFALSIFIAIPAVYISSLLEKHSIARLITFIVVLVGAFLLYDYILTILAHFFIHRNWQTGTLEIWSNIIGALDGYYNPAFYLSDVLFFERFWLGFGVLIGGGAALVAGSVALAKLVCEKLRLAALDGGESAKSAPSTIDDYGSVRAMLRYEARQIIRNKTYSYFYLGVAISTPVMVFFCNRLVTMVGEAQVGAGINFGASILVTAVFMSMISSFAGSTISVEGKMFYMTKLVPVPYRKQLLIKGIMSVAVSWVALIISAVVIACLEFISAVDIVVVVATELMLSVGLVLNGINLNLANPNLKPKANGEAEEINIIYMLLIGLVIAALLGAQAIILPRVADGGKAYSYVICLCVAAVYAAINFVVYWLTVDKKYRKIEA